MKTKPIALAAAGLVLLAATSADATAYRCWASGKPPPGQGWSEGTALAGNQAAAKQGALQACKARRMTRCAIVRCMSFPG